MGADALVRLSVMLRPPSQLRQRADVIGDRER